MLRAALKIGEKILNFYLNIRILRTIVFLVHRLKNILATVWNLIIWERETIQKLITIYIMVLIFLDFSFFKQSVLHCNSIAQPIFFLYCQQASQIIEHVLHQITGFYTIDSIIFLCRVSGWVRARYVVISLKNKNYKNPDRRMASVKQKISYVNIVLILHSWY